MSTWATAQFTNVGLGWWRTNPANPNIGRGFAIGNLTTTPFPAAFQVHGDLTATLTGEVFRTNAPPTILGAPNSTYWRMFHGGSTPGFERGQLFAEPTAQNGLFQFNINAPNGHLQFHTQNVNRARLNGNVTGPIGPAPALEFPNINRDGFLVLSGTPDAFTNGTSRAPFTRLHLVDDAVSISDPTVYAQQHGFRPWQRNGITFTGNSDQSYIGHRYAGNDNTDFVIQWSDNPNGSPWGTDRMKFVFNTQYNAAASRGAQTVNGLEALRLWPRNNLEVNVGIGDFSVAGAGDPTERLHVLSGRVRVHELPEAANEAAPGTYEVMVVDNSAAPSGERGVVKWVDPSVFAGGGGGGTSCEWTLQGAPGSNSNIATAYASNPGCPQDDRSVGIGVSSSISAKLDVYKQANSGTVNKAVQGVLDGTAPGKTAAYFEVGGTGTNDHVALNTRATGADGSGSRNLGTIGWSIDNTSTVTSRNVGVQGQAQANASGNVTMNIGLEAVTSVNSQAQVTNNYGLYADATNAADSTINYGGYLESYAPAATVSYGVKTTSATSLPSGWSYGIHATATAPDSTRTWAGYFTNRVQIQGALWHNAAIIFSDEQLKTDVAEVTADHAAELLGQLQPKSYSYDADAFPQMNLPAQQQFGFLAQEVEEVLPQLVHSTMVAPVVDSTGTVVHEAMAVKGVNYVGMIPLLVAGYRSATARTEALEQQLAQQSERLAHLEEMLAACCAAMPVDPQLGGGARSLSIDDANADDRSLRIQPNPFSESTTVYYTLERAGRAQLMANSADGKQLRVLTEARLEAGQYQHVWNTTDLSPGVYYVTLLLDGEPIVKKAVKVDR